MIVQTSVKTVKSIGLNVLFGMWETMTAGIEVPVTLHLDHCPERQVITDCLERGWNSVLFDASTLPVAENQGQTIEVVAEARRHGAHVEGEIEAIKGVEDGIGTDTETRRQSLETAITFIRETGVDVFAPSIGNAHGVYVLTRPRLRARDRAGGGRRHADRPARRQRHDGCAVPRPHLARVREGEHLDRAQDRVHAIEPRLCLREGAESADKWDPPSLFADVRSHIVALTTGLAATFGSAGKAW